MYVFRRPFDHAPHQAARVEWQPQPEWWIDCGPAEITVTTYAATIGTPTTIYCNVETIAVTTYAAAINAQITINCALESLAVTTYRATVGSYRIIECTVDEIALATYAASITAELLHIPVGGMSASVSESSIGVRETRNSIGAQVAQNQIQAA